MREVKHRAWVVSEKVLVDVLSINLKDKTVTLPIETPPTASHWWNESTWNLEDVVLLQYTGLKDKNGREIYEGDIDCEDNGFKSIVCYLKRYGAYCFVPVELYKYEDYEEQVNYHYGTDCYFDNARPSKYSNIIGNIYENPELIEVTNNV